MATSYKHTFFLCCSLLAALAGVAQDTGKPAEFEIISRSTLSGGKSGRLGLTASGQEASFTVQRQQGKAYYSIQANGGAALVPALDKIELAPKADRVLVYGDSVDRHVSHDLFLTLYNSHGGLIKSMGRVAVMPYVATLLSDGSVVVAGNSGKQAGKPDNFLRLYDRQGNLVWSKPLPGEVPNNVFTSADGRYIAVTTYDLSSRNSSVRYYSGKGALVRTHANSPSISGIEFLPSGKVVISSASNWYLYDLAGGYKYITAGSLPGFAVGRYPVSSHPSKDIFYIVTTNAAAKSGYSLQAYDGKGALLARGAFDGTPASPAYRMVAAGADGTVRFITDKEIITLRMK